MVMSANEYHFVTQWRVESTPKEVSEILADAVDLPRWWPSVYLEVKVLEPGDQSGIGRVVDLYTKGWLPYTLRWQFRVTAVDPHKRIELEAQGDFVGRGIWTFEPDSSDPKWVNVTYDWKIRAEKPLLRILSPLLKPIFGANHQWAMARGYESLLLEIQRRRAPTPRERSLVPAPPPPTTSSPLPMLLGGGAVFWAIYMVIRALLRGG